MVEEGRRAECSLIFATCLAWIWAHRADLKASSSARLGDALLTTDREILSQGSGSLPEVS